MTTTLVSSHNSRVTHLTNDDPGRIIKTLCGRALTSFRYNEGAFTDCEKCAQKSEVSFDEVRDRLAEEWRKDQEARKEAQRQIQEKNAQKLQQLREATSNLVNVLVSEFPEIVEQISREDYARGSEVIFSLNGIQFKLRGGF